MDELQGPTPAQVEALWGRRTSLRAQLCVSVDEGYARALSAARRWFEMGFAEMGGQFRRAVTGPLPAVVSNSTRALQELPGAISVQLVTMLDEQDQTPDVVYSEPAWEEWLLSLGRVPWLAALECRENDSTGNVLGPSLNLTLDRVDSGGTWLLFNIAGSADMTLAEPQRSALLRVLRAVAEHSNPVHGEVSWGTSFTQAVYEEATHQYPQRTLPNGRWALRSYAWVTILPEEIGERLGGLDALRASGAFVEVDHLAGGGYWCRATQAPEEFDQAAAERVFTVVAPALPPGRPDRGHVYPPNVLADRDPAEFMR
ncbi:hypothetical protein [Dactylosporangium sp. CA-233914]|uniref:hypothetical protein n=1 Tax=Dactylosporangium sp. CA-233914 TaxID=3239934 RepID=UPI003D8F97F3